jgi:teichuronic acid biosynthesis glycosyltransferase TuaG
VLISYSVGFFGDFMSDSFVSIITPTFNAERFIRDTYESINNQSHTNWEWIVTDDCSSDLTVDILLEISGKDSRVTILQNSVNGGAAVSRNRCLDSASGEYIAFLDSDDLWKPGKLLSQLKFMNSFNYKISFTSYELIDENGRSLNKCVDRACLGSIGYKELLKKRATFGCSTVMLRSSVIQGKRMPLLRTGQDYAFWLSLLSNGTRAAHLAESFTRYRVVPGSISRNKGKKALRQWQIYRQHEGLSIAMSTWCFCFYAIRAVFRR